MRTLLMLACSFFVTTVASAEGTKNLNQISDLKSEIVSIANSATSKIKRQNEFNPLTRKQLDPLVQKLVAISSPKTVQEQLEASVGSWKSILSDLPYTTAIASQIYQVLFPTGYYYNVSKYETEAGETYTSFIRGEYSLRKSNFEIKFTKAVKADGYPEAGTDLYRLSMLAELGVYDGQIDSENTQGLGRVGTLSTLYIDSDLRVVGGELKSNGVPDSLFILIPQSTIQ